MNKLIKSTTVCAVLKDNKIAIGADGQATMGNTVAKSNVNKIRVLNEGKILAGFAGAAADAMALFEKFEGKLTEVNGNLQKAVVEMAKDWRMDKVLRELDALLAIMDNKKAFILSGSGDVIEPEDGLIGIGSAGVYALAAARALMEQEKLSAEEIAKKAMTIASDICIYTNSNLTIEKL